MSRTPPVLTANICGGLGNQLFQVANLIGASARSGVPMMLERAPLSSSIEEPRPTYWNNMLRKFTSDICVDVPESQRHVLQQHQGNVVREFRGDAASSYPQIEKILLPKGDGSQSDNSIENSPNFKNICPSYNKNDPLFRLIGFFQSSQFFGDAGEAIKEVFTEEAISMAAKQHLHQVYNRDGGYRCTELSMPGGGYSGLPASLLRKHKKVEGNTTTTDTTTNSSSSSSSISSSSTPLKADSPYIIGMHVRRGDYLRHTDTFEVLPSSYYDEALQSLLGPLLRWDEHRVFSGFGKGVGESTNIASSTTSSPTHQAASYLGLKPHRRFKLLIFTDDAAYGRIVAGSFMTKYPALDVMVVGEDEEKEAGMEALTSVRGQSISSSSAEEQEGVEIPLPRDVLDLHMMTHCHDLILANSSYSWWGAYLNHTPMGRVVAPSKWLVKEPYPAFSHIYEPRWTIL